MSTINRILATELTPKTPMPKKDQRWIATKNWNPHFFGHQIKKGDVVTVRSANTDNTGYIEIDLRIKHIPPMGMELATFRNQFQWRRK